MDPEYLKQQKRCGSPGDDAEKELTLMASTGKRGISMSCDHRKGIERFGAQVVSGLFPQD